MADIPREHVGRAGRRATRGRRRSPAGPSSARGGTPTARTPTRRRWSSCDPARRRAGRRPGRDRAADAPPRGRAGRRAHAHDDAPRRRTATLTPVPADRDGRLLRRLLPRRLRDDPRRPGRPAGRRRRARRPTWPSRRRPGHPSRGTSSTCAGCAAATRPPTRWRRRFGAREIAEGWTLNVEREDVCPVVTLPAGADIDGYLGDARQEGAPRDPAQGPPRRGGRRGPARRLRPTRSPTSRPSSTSTRGAGATTASSRRRRAATRAGSSSGGCSSCSAPTGPLRLTFLTVGGRRIAAGIHFETPDALPATTTPASTRTRATCRPASSWSTRYVQRALAAGVPAARLPARRRAVQVRVGRGRRADPAAAGPTNGTADDERARRRWDPCLEPGRAPDAARRPADPRRRGPRDRHERRRPGAPLLAGDPDRPGPLRRVGRLAVGGQRRPQAPARRRPGRWSSTSPTTRSRSARSPPTSPRSAPTSSTPTCTAPRSSRHAGGRSRSARPATAGRTSSSTVHSSRGPVRRGPGAAARADAADGPADRGLAGDRAQARRRGPDGGAGQPHLQRRRPPALRPPGAVLHAAARSTAWSPARRSSASSRGSSRRRATRRCSRRGRRSSRAVPDAYLLIVGEGSRRDALEAQARAAADRPSGRVHRPPRRRPGGDRRARRRGPAVLPRGAGPDRSSRRWRCRGRSSRRTSAGSPR